MSHDRHMRVSHLQDVFSLRRPKDIKAGLASGGKSIVKGLGAGVVGLVAAPALGAHQEGFVGFAKGAAAGIPRLSLHNPDLYAVITAASACKPIAKQSKMLAWKRPSSVQLLLGSEA